MTKLGKWLIIIFCVAAIIMLFRVGATIPAGVMTFTLFVAALLERILRIKYMRDAYRQHNSAGAQQSNADISRKEALEILELEEGATSAEVKKAHKRLIAKIHPDTGGSKYLAAQINQARDVLLGKK